MNIAIGSLLFMVLISVLRIIEPPPHWDPAFVTVLGAAAVVGFVGLGRDR